MKWNNCLLGDVITLKRGYDLPSRLRSPGEVPIVSSSGVTGFHNQAKILPPGVVTGRYGTLGEVFYIDEPFWPLNTALYVSDFKGANSRFISYFLRFTLKNFKSEKAAVPGFDRNVLHKIKVKVPTLGLQNKISIILSRHDDLIKLNEEKIALLQESARLIYKEWFVHLRFPGNEKVKIVNGVPEGWKEAELDTFAKVKNGFAFKSEEYSTQEGIPVVRTRDFSSSIFIEIGEDVRIPSSIAYKYDAYKLKYLDFLLIMVGASIGSYGIVLSSEVGYLQNQNMWSVYSTSDEVPQVFVVETMKFMIKKVMGHKVGAARDFFRKDSVRNLPIIIPSKFILEKFSESVLPLYQQIDVLRKINKQLFASKNILMPRLMNGDIEL